MSSAKSRRLIQRAISLPKGLLDRFEAGLDARLDAGFTRTDALLERQIKVVKNSQQGLTRMIANTASFTDRALEVRIPQPSTSAQVAQRFTRGLASMVQATDTALDNRISQNDSARIKTATQRIVSSAKKFESSFDAKLTQNLQSIDRATNQVQLAATASWNLVNVKALAFERVMELGISRIDSGIDKGVATGAAANQALAGLISNADQGLTGRLARVDRSLNGAIGKAASSYAQISGYATRNLTSADSRLATGLKTADAGIDTAVTAIVSAATATTSFATRSAQATDATLWRGVAKVDKRVEVFAGQTNSKANHAGKRATSAPALVAASLALVLGTLGTATGTSVVTAEAAPVEIDNSAQSETLAAKSVVSQYMSVRESFATLQASRSRSIATLETEIAEAQVKAQQTTIDGNAVIDIASQYAGVSYSRGGTTPRGFDCSGFTTFIYRQVGVSLPRTSGEQAAWADRVADSDRQVGDLMFWADRGGVHHVAIYAGDGLMWDSPRPGRRVGKTGIWGDPFYGRVPAAAVNKDAITEVVDKTAELEELKADVPQLEITVDPTPVD